MNTGRTTTMTNLKPCERIALNNFLNVYDDRKTYAQIMDDMRESKDNITVCDMYNYLSYDDVMTAIENLRHDLYKEYGR
jgi:hypothetical protein